MIAWLGGVLMAICGIPMAWAAWKTKKDNTNLGLLILWTIGEICLALSYWYDPALMLNYATNLACLSVVWWVKFRYRGVFDGE